MLDVVVYVVGFVYGDDYLVLLAVVVFDVGDYFWLEMGYYVVFFVGLVEEVDWRLVVFGLGYGESCVVF